MKNVKLTEEKIKNAKKMLNEDQLYEIENLEGYVKEKYNEELLSVNIKKLVGYILNAKQLHTKNKDKPYTDSWKKKKLFALKIYYGELKKPIKMIDNLADGYFKKMVKDNLNNQEQSDKVKENYLTYDELNIIRDGHKNYKTKRQMFKYLILSAICTDQPSLRPQIYASLNIVTKKKDIHDDEKNYMYINKKKKTGYLYINDDKVDKNNEKNKMIELQPKFLKIILDSLQKFPREKFIEYLKSDGTPVVKQELKLLYELHLATGNKFNFDMARSSFVNDWNKKHPDATDAEKMELARLMRHTYTTQLTYYKKKETVSGNLEKIKEQKEQKENEKNNKNIEKKDKEKKYYEKYYEVNKIRALISKANKKSQVIKDETMLKYGILKNNDGKYYYPKQIKENF